MFRSPAFIVGWSRATRRNVGAVLSDWLEITFSTAVGGTPPELWKRLTVLLALSLRVMKLTRHVPSSAFSGKCGWPIYRFGTSGSFWQEKPCRALPVGLVM